jgi:steroid 5-alpha reductase family enzyme
MSYLISFLTVPVLLSALFLYADARRRYDLIDSAWGPGFALIAVITMVFAEGEPTRQWVVSALTVVWGVRLGAHILVRNSGMGEDPRYQEILRRAKENPRLRMYRVYLVQAVLMWIVSLPVQAAQHLSVPFGVLDWVGTGVWMVGFAFEAVGDWQLSRFRADPANKGAVMDRGLWRYTRHPNYFGDAVVWWGLYLFALHSWLGALTIAGPAIMTWLLAKGTGKPLLEKDIVSRRPGYAEYVRRTSGFVPLPPRSRVG